MNLIKYRKIYYAFSGTLIIISVASLLVWRLNLGIDFTGGSLMEIEFKESRLSNQEIQDKLKDLDLGEVMVQPTGEKGVILRFKDIKEETHREILEKLGKDNLEEKRFDSIGPVIGKELQQKALKAIVLVLITIIVYLAWAFRKVSKPVNSVRYGIFAVVAVFHDILITTGVFSILGHFGGVEVGIPFVAAILTVLGYSVNDSVVVFDRIRENLIKFSGEFEEIVAKSLRETLVRSLNTGLCTLFTLTAICILGGESIRYFTLALIFGIAFGTYSSIFVASALLVSFRKKLFFGI